MVNAKECDRCGEIYGDFNPKLLGDMGLVDRDGEKVDLCPSCLEELEFWYGNEIEEFIKKYKKENTKENVDEGSIIKLNKKYQGSRVMIKKLHIKNQTRLEQQRRDHNFISLLKEMYPEQYGKVVEEIKKRFPNQIRLKRFRRDLTKKILE